MAGIDPVKYPSLPSNYVTIAELKERWLKEKERKQQEEKEKYPFLRNHENRIANGCTHSRGPVGKNLQKRDNHSGKGWRVVGLIAKEPKLKEVRMNGPVVEEGVDGARGKEKMGYFGKREARVERDGSGDMAKVSMIYVAEEEMMAVVSVERGGKESSKGNQNSGNQEVEEVATVCMVEVVGESNVDREIAGGKCRVGYRGKKNSWSVEQSGQKQNAGKEKVSVDVKERTNEKVRVSGAFRAYGDKEVASVDVEVVGENKVDREIAGQNCGVGFREQKHNAGKEVVPVDVKERTYEKVRVRGAYRGKKNSGKQMVERIGEVSDKADSVEQSGQECNAEKEKVSVDLKERTNEKVTVSGAFCAYSAKETEEVATVCTVEVVEENKVDREISGKKHRVGFKGKKPSWRKISDRVGEVSDKANSVEQSGRECNAEKEKLSVDVKERTNEKVRVKGAFGDKEVEEVATVCTVEVVEEIKVDRKIAGKKRKVWYKGKKHSGRKMADRVGEVSDKADSAEQSGQELNAEKEESKDVLIDSEASLNRTIEGDLGDLSLTDRRYGHGRSSVRVYGDKSYRSSRRYDVRKMLKQRDNSFAWIKKGESSNGNVAEIETQSTGLGFGSYAQPSELMLFPKLWIHFADFLAYIVSSTRGCSPWRPNVVMAHKWSMKMLHIWYYRGSLLRLPVSILDEGGVVCGSGCTSECESGWTMYFDELSYSSDQFNGVKGRSIYDGRGRSAYVDEDLSMVSDASSGPPHNNFHENKEFCCEENGNFLYTSETENTKEKQKREMKEQSGKKQNLYLDDTASSPVSTFQKDNTGFYNDTTYMEQVAGNSGTYSKGKSVLGKHFGFLKTSVNGKASSEKSGV
ncbi:hypothetical protein H5410_063175 [Solanum commersonii]|uniref:Uncharacterized protein n=1 Tax=Solanum commersonii TaxID=4109 RepID=A0A9J5WCK3_SOLCO|nr:hypothetical protein H5410_063175 [Solanum commersonii]